LRYNALTGAEEDGSRKSKLKPWEVTHVLLPSFDHLVGADEECRKPMAAVVGCWALACERLPSAPVADEDGAIDRARAAA
jgi:hypothetical protein